MGYGSLGSEDNNSKLSLPLLSALEFFSWATRPEYTVQTYRLSACQISNPTKLHDPASDASIGAALSQMAYTYAAFMAGPTSKSILRKAASSGFERQDRMTSRPYSEGISAGSIFYSAASRTDVWLNAGHGPPMKKEPADAGSPSGLLTAAPRRPRPPPSIPPQTFPVADDRARSGRPSCRSARPAIQNPRETQAVRASRRGRTQAPPPAPQRFRHTPPERWVPVAPNCNPARTEENYTLLRKRSSAASHVSDWLVIFCRCFVSVSI